MVRYTYKKYNFNNHLIKKEIEKTVDEAKKIFSDHELKLLLCWIIIGPLAALGYLIWVKYERFRPVSIVLFTLSLIYFIGQCGGLAYIISRILGG